MGSIAIKAEGLSKKYRLGTIGYGTLYKDLSAWLARIRGREDPNAVIGEKSRLNSRGDFWALRDVSFEVEQGDRVGIIGRNGAGKSTVLKILSRITRPTEGKVSIRGRIASLLEVGTGFHAELTGRENIFLNGAIMGMKRGEIEKRFDEIVDFSGVEEFIDTPVKRYSSGMYVRLAFAVAAHLDPDILVVDEVLSVGDANFQKKCIGKMESSSKIEGRTIVVVSHNLKSLQSLCSNGILLESGRITLRGSMKDVIEGYLGVNNRGEGQIAWSSPEEAPGDARVRLRAVRVVGSNGTSSEIGAGEGFAVEIDYWNIEEGKRRLASIHITDSAGTTILTSVNLPSFCLTEDPWSSRKMPKGLFRTRCTIPGNVLNTGAYKISVAVVENRSAPQSPEDVSFWEQEILGFSVREKTVSADFDGAWVGVVRMRLEWDTQCLANHES
jgi:lipopolysaccharide transport system ATP-binding protein